MVASLGHIDATHTLKVLPLSQLHKLLKLENSPSENSCLQPYSLFCRARISRYHFQDVMVESINSNANASMIDARLNKNVI